MLDPKKRSSLSKIKKMTFLDLIEKQEKNKNIPGPGAYEAKIKNKVLGALHLMEEKTSFIDEA